MEDALYILFTFTFGLCLGSFLNALVYRLHEKKSLWGRSECPECQAKIKWYDNLPVLSFFILKFKCRTCQQKISWQYPIVELLMGLLFLIPVYLSSPGDLHGGFRILFDWLIIFDLMLVFLYDLKYGEIPDLATLPLTGLLAALAYLSGWNFLQDGLFGALIGGGFFAIQYVVSRGRWVGGGDITLGFLMGIILGWRGVVLALFLAYVGGAIISLLLLALKKKAWQSAVPFGVFLVPATLIALWWGERIVNWYLSLLR
jgi:prepilin signal peptidase PulO-like enzyme (type II secretory pathway)